MKFILFITISAVILSAAIACRPIIRMYESSGNEETAREWFGIDSEANLTSKGLSLVSTQVCIEGLWMAYEGYDFSGDAKILAEKNGLHNCQNLNGSRSVKIIGYPGNYETSAVMTFLDEGNLGLDNLYINDTNRISESFNSLLLIGNEEIQLFSNTYFGGLSVCVRPNNGDINTAEEFTEVNHGPGSKLYTNLISLKNILGFNEFKSFRFGCSL